MAWRLPVLPGAAILCLVLAVNLLGEGRRDALDPRMLLGASVPRAGTAAPPLAAPRPPPEAHAPS